MKTSSYLSKPKDQQLISQLREEVKGLREQLARLQRLATMGTMTAMVAHELNNILTPMLNYPQLAADGDEAMRDEAIRQAYEGSVRAIAICRALLNLSAPEEKVPTSVSVKEVVEEALALMARDAAKDGILLITKVPADLVVRTRPVELKQVLLNLLLNARQALRGRGRERNIAITALRHNGEVLIEVADTGPGIPREIRRRIFEPFFTTRRGEGTGLGLPVCKHIMKMLHGRLTCHSQEGKGARFTVYLPANGKAPKATRRTRKPAAKAKPPGRPKRATAEVA